MTEMQIRQYDSVLLKDGRRAAIVEVLSPTDFIADVGDSPETWETIDVTLDQIERRLTGMYGKPYND